MKTTSKDIINRVKTQPTDHEEIFVNHVSDKELISTTKNYNSTTKITQLKMVK
jgi:hypothetical protein